MDELEDPEVSALAQINSDGSQESVVTGESTSSASGYDTAQRLGLDSGPETSPEHNREPVLYESPKTYRSGGQTGTGSDPGGNVADQKPSLPSGRVALPTRPPLFRESSAPRAPQQSAQQPAPPTNEAIDPTLDPPDSLTLADLKRIRSGFPNAQPVKQELFPLHKVYDYEYQDAQAFPIEIDEWFGYGEGDRRQLLAAHRTFETLWARHNSKDEHSTLQWTESTSAATGFVNRLVDRLGSDAREERVDAIRSLCYIALGVWVETAERHHDRPFEVFFEQQSRTPDMTAYHGSAQQVYWMLKNVGLLVSSNALPAIYDNLKASCDRDLAASLELNDDTNGPPKPFNDADVSTDIWCGLTIAYIIFEVLRLSGDNSDAETLKRNCMVWLPKYLMLCTEMIAQMRWDEAAPIPSSKIFLLYWKLVLLTFGGVKEVDQVKLSFKDKIEDKDSRGQALITASPLDYHLFRQEISSKYPAYQAPQPLFPFEPENNTLLPPLSHRQAKLDNVDSPSSANATNSIMHQPVHIATPAPSPPPSPAGPGGKGGKKQNYQTNQMFPFLYPPLDASSNDIGGKGTTELQDALVGRKWQGSDIPTSILEAAELFAKRMRATRAMKQLWEARVDFMRYDRGWRDDESERNIERLDLDDGEDGKNQPQEDGQSQTQEQTDAEKRLAVVEDYYRHSLPYLQSVVIVLLKAVLKHVTDLVTASGNRYGVQNGFQEPNGASQMPLFENGDPQATDGMTSTSEQVENARTQEITSKALTAVLLLLLKWFKVSHILRYEYLTQLLLDANYVPLILKLWQTQDIGRACHFKLDREDLNFFAFCRSQSSHPSTSAAQHPPPGSSSSDSSFDDAAPPPIKINRQQSPASTASDADGDYSMHPPEVDELGYPQTPLPPRPMTNFSHRNITSSINYLRILQKITRRKTHRSLLLVSYKSSNHLKKTLRVPVDMLRYYTLKLFKSQVPFCGRKWRQSNMKIITAVWLSVPADLRDDWLVGGGGGMGGSGPGDVDGTVDEALPLEQSLRSLTHWWNVRFYPAEMGVGKEFWEREHERRDFFGRELERLEREGGLGEMQEEEGEGEGDEWAGLVEGY